MGKSFANLVTFHEVVGRVYESLHGIAHALIIILAQSLLVENVKVNHWTKKNS